MSKYISFFKLQDRRCSLYYLLLASFLMVNFFNKLNPSEGSSIDVLSYLVEFMLWIMLFVFVLKILYFIISKWWTHLALLYIRPVMLMSIIFLLLNAIYNRLLINVPNYQENCMIDIGFSILSIYMISMWVIATLSSVLFEVKGFVTKKMKSIEICLPFFRRSKKYPMPVSTGFVVFIITCTSSIIGLIKVSLGTLVISEDLSHFIDNILIYLPFLISFLLVYLSMPRHYSLRQKKLKIELLDLDYIDILKNGFYITNSFNKMGNGRFFKINVAECIPEIPSIQDIIILNKEFKNTKLMNHSIQARQYLYVFCESNTFPTTQNLEILLIQRNEIRDRFYKLNVLLQFDSLGGEIIIRKSEIIFLRRLIFAFQRFRLSWKDVECSHLAMFRNSYIYNADFINQSVNIYQSEDVFARRKWLFHNGEYGCGKSALDALIVSQAGKIPVIITPWEDNYDNDILFLIFQRIMKNSSLFEKMVTPSASVIIFFLAALTSFSAILITILQKLASLFAVYFGDITTYKIDMFDNLFVLDIFRSINSELLYIYIISIGLALLLSLTLLPYIIIHVKDSSKVHQEYYIRKIASILKKHQKLLIVEDVDRLGIEAQERVFRIASNINKACGSTNQNHYIGIISLEKTNLKVDFSNLENKVLNKEILINYEGEKSIKSFFTEYLIAIIGYYMWKHDMHQNYHFERYYIEKIFQLHFPKSELELRRLTVVHDNFRTIHSYIEEIIFLLDSNISDDNLLKILNQIH